MNSHQGLVRPQYWHLACAVSVSVLSTQVSAQGLEEALTEVTGSASVFAAMNHTRTDTATGTDTNTEPSVGLSGVLGGEFVSGANSLALQYAGTVETSRDNTAGESSDTSSFNGVSRFQHLDPASRFDFNAGHTVRSVRNDTGFVINPNDYDTQNVVNAGAGFRLYPGDLTTLRLSADGSRSFGDADAADNESWLGKAEIQRRLSSRSASLLTASRSWADEDNLDLTIDSAVLAYITELESGSFTIGAGFSKAEAEFNGGQVIESDGIVGYMTRVWLTPEWTSSLSYTRTLSDSAIDQVANPTVVGGFLDEDVRLNELAVTDTVDFQYTTRGLCDVCDGGMILSGSIRESEYTGATTHEYLAGVNLGIQISSLQRLEFRYLWQGDAGDDAGTVLEEIHRFDTRWSRLIGEETTFGLELNQSYLRSKLARNDEDEFVLRVVLTHGFSLVGRN